MEKPALPGSGSAGSTMTPASPSGEIRQAGQLSVESPPPAGDVPRPRGHDLGMAVGDTHDGSIATPSTSSENVVPAFTTGRVLARTWQVLMMNPGVYFGLALIPSIPIMIGDLFRESFLPGFMISTAGSCLWYLLQAAVAYAVYRFMCGESVTTSEALSKGFRRFVPVLGASVVVGALTVIGYILLFIPGLILNCIFVVTIPACVVERVGSMYSLQRSSELTQGYRWKIFLLLAAVLAVTFVISFLTAPLRRTFSDNVFYLTFIRSLVLIVPAAFHSVMTAVIYFTLREVKEGLSLENLATVFE